ncbi:MAG TPA: M56 family metallopeptidase [Bryobacteraceae bacterium]|nr:M56 family metallopeptidase [Bryobacteraceae bacterium]
MTSPALVSLANHLWQSTIFAVAVWLIACLLRSNAASLRHRLWVTASVKFLVPFSLLVGLGARLPLRTAPVASPRPVSVVVSAIGTPFPGSTFPKTSSAGGVLQPPEPPSSRLPYALAALWFCGFAGCAGWWFLRWRQFRRALRRGVPLDLDIPIPAISLNERIEPGVFGVFRPVLLLPEGIAQRLTPEQLKAVVAHEMSHVWRRDNVANAIHMLAEALFWFHPLVWWIERRLLDEQERACDEEVLRQGGDPQVYAESILRVCEFYVTSPLICIPGITGADLKMRVREIMRAGVRPRLNVAGRLSLYMAAVLALAGPMVVGVAVRAQTTGTRGSPRFEVASIKPGNKDFGFADLGLAMLPTCGANPRTVVTPGGIRMCGPLRLIIQGAYKREDENLVAAEARGGPAWLDSEIYEIIAKAEGNPSIFQMAGPMLQTLLEERFRLKVHRDQKEVPVYFLKVAKGGSKFHPAKKGSCITLDPENPSQLTSPSLGKPGTRICGGARFDGRSLEMYSATMADFARQISRYFDRRLIDNTGLTGVFDIHMDVVPEDSPSPAPTDAAAPPAGDPMAELRAMTRVLQQRYEGVIVPALQNQLGLTMESGKGPGDTLVIDHIERPSPN